MTPEEFLKLDLDQRPAILKAMDCKQFATFLNKWASSQYIEFSGTIFDELLRRLKIAEESK